MGKRNALSKIRSVKSARIKLEVLKETKALIGKGSFKNLYVSELCKKVKISKVTLFKYFPQKEDILLYYLRIWCLDLAVSLKNDPREGLKGIYYLTDELSDEYERHPGLILSLLGHIATMERFPKPFTVKEEERKLLYPKEENLEKIEIKSIEQFIEGFILEAIFKGEITKRGDTNDLMNLVLSQIYGVILTAHQHRISPIKLYFRRNIDALITGLK